MNFAEDVYKRQAICILCSHWLLAGEIWISPKGNDFNDGTRQSPKATLMVERMPLGTTDKPVSYTHLDVYKRQDIYIRLRSSSHNLFFKEMNK